MHNDVSSCVALDRLDEQWFPMQTGLTQGCVMSPYPFNIYMDVMIKKVRNDAPGGWWDLGFENDMALLADSWRVMVALVMKIEHVVLQGFGIDISAKKHEILYIGRAATDFRVEVVQLRMQAMKTVEELTYLGSV